MVAIFFEKGYVTRRTLLEGQKNDNFWVSFRQKCLRRCQNKKKGGLGGAKPLPESKREAESWQSSCCFCCCLLLFFCFSGCCCVYVYWLLLLVVVVVLFLLLLFCCCCCSHCCCHSFCCYRCCHCFSCCSCCCCFPRTPKEKIKKHLFFQCFFALFSSSPSVSLS